MSFQKKQRIATTDGRPQGTRLEQREAKVAALREANTPEARKTLKKMNDVVYRGSRSNLREWYKPNGGGVTCR